MGSMLASSNSIVSPKMNWPRNRIPVFSDSAGKSAARNRAILEAIRRGGWGLIGGGRWAARSFSAIDPNWHQLVQ